MRIEKWAVSIECNRYQYYIYWIDMAIETESICFRLKHYINIKKEYTRWNTNSYTWKHFRIQDLCGESIVVSHRNKTEKQWKWKYRMKSFQCFCRRILNDCCIWIFLATFLQLLMLLLVCRLATSNAKLKPKLRNVKLQNGYHSISHGHSRGSFNFHFVQLQQLHEKKKRKNNQSCNNWKRNK